MHCKFCNRKKAVKPNPIIYSECCKSLNARYALPFLRWNVLNANQMTWHGTYTPNRRMADFFNLAPNLPRLQSVTSNEKLQYSFLFYFQVSRFTFRTAPVGFFLIRNLFSSIFRTTSELIDQPLWMCTYFCESMWS